MELFCREASLPDPRSGQSVPILKLKAGRMEATALPGRCMDLYEASFSGVPVSCTDKTAGILDPDYVCRGAESFQRSFFAGMLTTCGLIQAGRPCEESGRAFGLHGAVGHIAASAWHWEEQKDGILLSAQIKESHPEGERLLLKRAYRIWDGGISWQDQVVNLGKRTPFMLMYHINFGAPFLSPGLRMETDFAYAEDRDTGLPADEDRLLRMEAPQAGRPESVYYTRLKNNRVALLSEGLRLRAELTFSGLPWMGVWKSYSPALYALGLEPCACPGLGRVRARERGLLPELLPGQTHQCGASLRFTEWEKET